VGGVNGRPARETGGAILSRARARNGGRHPGPRGAGNLRGLTEERGSWSVRWSATGLVPMQAIAPATTGVLWKKEEGNVVSMRQAHALVAVDAQQAPPRMRTRPSLSPETRARLSPLNSQRESVATVVRSVRYRGRASLRKQEEPAPGSERTDGKRGSPRVTASRGNSGRSCVMRQKRKVVMAIVPARKRESRTGVRTSCSVAEVGRQHPGLE
jgi:hypothetical protein